MAFALKQWQEFPIGRERDEVGCEAGISGQSCLRRSYNSYGFDISHDLTYDAMHTLASCIVKKYVHTLAKHVAKNGIGGVQHTVGKLLTRATILLIPHLNQRFTHKIIRPQSYGFVIPFCGKVWG